MNITKRDVLELRRRLTKKDCSIDRMSGCYVNGSKNVILKFSEFLPIWKMTNSINTLILQKRRCPAH